MKKLVNRSNPLAGALPSAPPADTHPYIVKQPYGRDRYAKTIGEAKAMLIKDLDTDMQIRIRLGHEDCVLAIQALKAAVSGIGVDGGSASGPVDPHVPSAVYRATIMLRNPVG